MTRFFGAGDNEEVFKEPCYLSDYLLFTGVVLEDNKGHKVTCVERVSQMVFEAFKEGLLDMFISFYAQLVFIVVVGRFELINEMVHDAWSVATVLETAWGYHKSLLPFSKIPKEVQGLDTTYTKELNEVVSYLVVLDKFIRG